MNKVRYTRPVEYNCEYCDYSSKSQKVLGLHYKVSHKVIVEKEEIPKGLSRCGVCCKVQIK